jgi:NAD-dependent DNA ligase
MDILDNSTLLKRYNSNLLFKKSIQEFQGVAAAIIYDKKIEDTEIRMLMEWVSNHKDIEWEWPIKDVMLLLDEISMLGKVLPAARKKLLKLLSNFAADSQLPPVAEGIFDKKPNITFKDKTFMFTGNLSFGSRKFATDTVIKLGGKVPSTDKITGSIDYLIVGDLGQACWKYNRFGSKIEAAIKLREEWGGLYIVRERAFVEAVIAMSSVVG